LEQERDMSLSWEKPLTRRELWWGRISFGFGIVSGLLGGIWIGWALL
jgi:hypothetical protein